MRLRRGKTCWESFYKIEVHAALKEYERNFYGILWLNTIIE